MELTLWPHGYRPHLVGMKQMGLLMKMEHMYTLWLHGHKPHLVESHETLWSNIDWPHADGFECLHSRDPMAKSVISIAILLSRTCHPII